MPSFPDIERTKSFAIAVIRIPWSLRTFIRNPLKMSFSRTKEPPFKSHVQCQAERHHKTLYGSIQSLRASSSSSGAKAFCGGRRDLFVIRSLPLSSVLQIHRTVVHLDRIIQNGRHFEQRRLSEICWCSKNTSSWGGHHDPGWPPPSHWFLQCL